MNRARSRLPTAYTHTYILENNTLHIVLNVLSMCVFKKETGERQTRFTLLAPSTAEFPALHSPHVGLEPSLCRAVPCPPGRHPLGASGTKNVSTQGPNVPQGQHRDTLPVRQWEDSGMSPSMEDVAWCALHMCGPPVPAKGNLHLGGTKGRAKNE